MSNILDKICAEKREYLRERKRLYPLSEVYAAIQDAAPTRGFSARLREAIAAGDYGLIAEIKRASPSKGVIREDFDPAALASAYAAGGATCLSVLTDFPYFQGKSSYLSAARSAVRLPVLRKDFILDSYQIVESKAIGADCVLLILAALDDCQAGELASAAAELGMDVLVEVHDRREMTRAMELGATLIGINNRNLKTLEVDLRTTEELARDASEDCLLVSESGLSTPSDLARMAALGVRCFLIGESLMRELDVEAATRALLGRGSL
jgi:indole-3-glycerol phosphate synthase